MDIGNMVQLAALVAALIIIYLIIRKIQKYLEDNKAKQAVLLADGQAAVDRELNPEEKARKQKILDAYGGVSWWEWIVLGVIAVVTAYLLFQLAQSVFVTFGIAITGTSAAIMFGLAIVITAYVVVNMFVAMKNKHAIDLQKMINESNPTVNPPATDSSESQGRVNDNLGNVTPADQRELVSGQSMGVTMDSGTNNAIAAAEERRTTPDNNQPRTEADSIFNLMRTN